MTRDPRADEPIPDAEPASAASAEADEAAGDELALVGRYDRRSATREETGEALDAEGSALLALERMRRLQGATAALARALSRDDVTRALLDACTHGLGADAAAVFATDGDVGERLADAPLHCLGARGWNEATVEGWRALRLDGDDVVAEVARGGGARWRDEEPPGAAHRAWAALPLLLVPAASDEVSIGCAGSLLLAFVEPRAFGEEDRAYLHTLAAVAAAAFDRARLHERALWAAGRASLLSDASRALGEPLDRGEILRLLPQLVVPAFADFCVVYERDAEGGSRRVAARHVDDERGRALAALRRERPLDTTGGTPVAHVLRTHEPIFEPRVDEPVAHALLDANEAAVAEMLDPCSALVIPLEARGRALGVVAFAMVHERAAGSGRHYTADDLLFARSFAERAALALDTAFLLAEARAARETAEAAARAKSDFLAVMSHELRTPLNAILGYTGLLEEQVSGPLTGGQRAQLARVRAGAQHLLVLIDEVLTLARLDADKERIHLAPVDLGALLHEVAMLVEPSASARGLRLRVAVAEPPDERCTSDATKVRQILLNLASNAIKFTEEGQVSLSLRWADGHAELAVADTGRGIAPEHLERVFEPFWQVDQRHSRSIGGTGLGLGVSRRLAHMLGGELAVRSEVGAGSTFVLRLPCGGG